MLQTFFCFSSKVPVANWHQQGTIILIVFTLFFVKCTNIDKNELIGTYQARDNINTIDTLLILKDGIYQRALYRKNDQSLIYKHTGKWAYEDGMIELDSFYMDYDNVYKINAGGFKESSQYCFFEVNKILRKIYIGTKISGVYLYVKL